LSHVVEIETEVRDTEAMASACRRLGLAQPQRGTTTLFQTVVSGLLVQLQGWRFPIVVSPETGQVKYDNYEGLWGEQRELERFLQIYLVEKVRIEARKAGHSMTEQVLEDGSIAVEMIQVGGMA
jgi:hypothetical protein